MGVAFEMTRIALGLADRFDQANELVAKRIIAGAGAPKRTVRECGSTSPMPARWDLKARCHLHPLAGADDISHK